MGRLALGVDVLLHMICPRSVFIGSNQVLERDSAGWGFPPHLSLDLFALEQSCAIKGYGQAQPSPDYTSLLEFDCFRNYLEHLFKIRDTFKTLNRLDNTKPDGDLNPWGG